MQPPGPGTLRFLRRMRSRGFLAVIGDLWREYGDVFQVRVGSRRLIVTVHPDAVARITVTHRTHYDKIASYDPVRKYLTGDGLVASTGELWRRQRKLMAPFFTPKGIRVYADLMVRDGVRLQERWTALARQGARVEIAEEMTSITASIILKTMFGSDTIESIDRMKDAVETMVSFAASQSTGLAPPLWLPTPQNRKYARARALVHRSVARLLEQRRAAPEADWPDDLLARWMKARDEETGEPMSEALLRDEAITTFFAGHETTARTMTFAWYALATNSGVSARLHAELDRVLAGRVPTADDLQQLPYTLHVIKEVLRLHPPAPFYTRDAVAGDRIAGFDVPAGATMMLTPYYTHRHPQFWDDPEVFEPDRWNSEPETRSWAYHPFGAGPRTCIGNNFSLLESVLLLAILAQRFTPQLRRDYEPEWEMRGVLNLANGLPMVIAAR